MYKINVMFVLRPAAGGMKKHVISLIQKLDRRKFNPFLVCPQEVVKSNDETLNCRIFNIELEEGLNPRREWRAFKCLKEIMVKNKIHIVHCHGARSALIGRLAAWRAGVPVIINTVHNFIYEDRPFFPRYTMICMNRFLNSVTDKQITVSNALKEAVIRAEGCKPSSTQTVYNGIDLKEFNYLLDCSEAKEKLHIKPSDPVVGLVSRMIPEKGIDLFLKAARLISEKKPGVQFLAAGEGPFRKRFEKLAKELGIGEKVIFTGYVEKVPPILSLLNVVVIPSLNEGLCISAIEALAARRPVVAFETGGIPEVISHGKTGILVEKGDYAALALKVMDLLENSLLRNKLGILGRQTVEKKFTLQRMVSENEKIYETLLSEKGYHYLLEEKGSEAAWR